MKVEGRDGAYRMIANMTVEIPTDNSTVVPLLRDVARATTAMRNRMSQIVVLMTCDIR